MPIVHVAKITDKMTSPNLELWMRDRPWIDRDDADIKRYVAGLATHPTYDLEAKLNQWRDSGFVVFENAVAHEVIDALLADLREFQSNFRRYSIPMEVRGQQLQSTDLPAFPENETGIKINHLHCFSRAAALTSLAREVVDFLGHVFRAPPATLQSLMFWRGSQQPIHIDYPYVRAQRRLAYLAASWVALEDVHPDSGPLGYYRGGHKVERSGFFDWGNGSIVHSDKSARTPMDFAEYLAQRMTAERIARENFCPKRGDVFIWHGNLPHEGTKVSNPALTRKSYVTHFTSLPDLPTWLVAGDDLADRRFASNGGFAFINGAYAKLPRLPSWTNTARDSTR
jgi:phytanoyl-CoA hydroxylase